jgi:hypothetical protein
MVMLRVFPARQWMRRRGPRLQRKPTGRSFIGAGARNLSGASPPRL